jgi:hypothetical protein
LAGFKVSFYGDSLLAASAGIAPPGAGHIMATSTVGESRQPVHVPPEERFWQRYSPHQEMPLSTFGSLVLHVLAIGALILGGWLGWFGFGKSAASLPVETVRFGIGNEDKLRNPGSATEGNAVTAETMPEANDQPPADDPMRPKLEPAAVVLPPLSLQNDDILKRYVQEGKPNNPFEDIINSLKQEKGPKGPNTPGGPGGSRTPPPPRVARMLRWTMVFNTRTGMDYLAQLRSIGAILAIPTGPDSQTYKIVRDLSGRGPAKLLDEDISKIQSIFWKDNRPESVAALMKALHYPQVPSHFYAFMPRKVEQDLSELEKQFAGRSEDQIHSTKFMLQPTPKGYKFVVLEQKGL